MPSDGLHEISGLRSTPGELAFEARVGGQVQSLWLRTNSPVIPTADAALAACLMPAMRFGGTLNMVDPVSPRMLRMQHEFQAIQRTWSLDWEFGDPPLREVRVVAPTRKQEATQADGRVAAFFSGGVDSWSTILNHPEITDLIFVRGTDLVPGAPHQEGLADRIEPRLREAASVLGLPLHVVETNLRELSDPLARWETYCGCAVVAVALFLAPLFERVLIATDSDYEAHVQYGASWMVDRLWSTEGLEIVDDGGRFSRMERPRSIVDHPAVQRTLRVCWENRGGAYNCGLCSKCLLTMTALEVLGARERIATFPPHLDRGAIAENQVHQVIQLTMWEDLLDATRAAGRPDLESAVEAGVAKSKQGLGLPATYRRRHLPGPPPTVRIAVVVPVWQQAQYLAEAVQSALNQEITTGVGVVVVNDGCPDPDTDRIGRALRDARPGRLAYLHQGNRGVAAARNAGIRQAFARWPNIEAIFPLDADNVLSPHTLAKLSALLEENPDVAWASPALEFFGAEEGGWQAPRPFLPYRQLFSNQSDTGSLIRRAVFEAGIEFDETLQQGFEDWEFFLSATLAGFRGLLAGRCGFRYRRRPDSMIGPALQRAEELEAEIRDRHRDAYEATALIHREHAEAPRFALIRCDREDVLLTASGELEPQQRPLVEYARSLAAVSGDAPSTADHVPAMTVLTTSTAIDRLKTAGSLASALRRIQAELRGRASWGWIRAPAQRRAHGYRPSPCAPVRSSNCRAGCCPSRIWWSTSRAGVAFLCQSRHQARRHR